MSQQPPKPFSGRKHRVWSGETLDINLFWWLTYFKSILISLQALQCILCLPHIRHNFIRITPPLRQTQILGATWLAATRVLSQGKRENTGNEVAFSNNLCSVYGSKQELYKIQNFINWKNKGNICLQIEFLYFFFPLCTFYFFWGPGTWGGIYLDYSQYPLGYLCLPSDQASMWASLRFILTVVKDVFFTPSSSPCPGHSPLSYN